MSLFQKIIDKELPADIVYEDELCLAFKDIHPQAPIHILLIPKKAVRSLAAVTTDDKELLGHLMLTAANIAQDFKISEDGFRLVTNINKYGGQTVFHLHFHILGGRQLGSLG